jgi:hypothetical protein
MAFFIAVPHLILVQVDEKKDKCHVKVAESRPAFLGEDHFILVYVFQIHYIFAGMIEFKNGWMFANMIRRLPLKYFLVYDCLG